MNHIKQVLYHNYIFLYICHAVGYYLSSMLDGSQIKHQSILSASHSFFFSNHSFSVMSVCVWVLKRRYTFFNLKSSNRIVHPLIIVSYSSVMLLLLLKKKSFLLIKECLCPKEEHHTHNQMTIFYGVHLRRIVWLNFVKDTQHQNVVATTITTTRDMVHHQQLANVYQHKLSICLACCHRLKASRPWTSTCCISRLSSCVLLIAFLCVCSASILTKTWYKKNEEWHSLTLSLSYLPSL
jgi:hypothetical protein